MTIKWYSFSLQIHLTSWNKLLFSSIWFLQQYYINKYIKYICKRLWWIGLDKFNKVIKKVNIMDHSNKPKSCISTPVCAFQITRKLLAHTAFYLVWEISNSYISCQAQCVRLLYFNCQYLQENCVSNFTWIHLCANIGLCCLYRTNSSGTYVIFYSNSYL